MTPSKNPDREAREARERLRVYNARQAVHERQTTRRKRDNYFAIGGVVVIAALAAVTQIFYFNGGPGTPTPAPSFTAEAGETPAPGENIGDVPDPALAEGRTWTGTMGLNDVSLEISLDGAAAPQAVSSFVASTQAGYFTDKTCHRLVSSETAGLLQCGSLTGDGSTDTSYSFGPLENVPGDEIYPAGTIAMARVGDNAYSQGRQFFVVFDDTQLPNDSVGGYTVIGQVTGGLDALKTQIADAGVVDGQQDGAPVVPTTITSLTLQ